MSQREFRKCYGDTFCVKCMGVDCATRQLCIWLSRFSAEMRWVSEPQHLGSRMYLEVESELRAAPSIHLSSRSNDSFPGLKKKKEKWSSH